MTPSGPKNQLHLLRIAPANTHIYLTMRNVDFHLKYILGDIAMNSI
jgi:hypothetical protein